MDLPYWYFRGSKNGIVYVEKSGSYTPGGWSVI